MIKYSTKACFHQCILVSISMHLVTIISNLNIYYLCKKYSNANSLRSLSTFQSISFIKKANKNNLSCAMERYYSQDNS